MAAGSCKEMNNMRHTLIAFMFAMAAAVTVADDVNTVYNAQRARALKAAPENAARVGKEAAAAGIAAGKVVHFAVPAMSDVMRLQDTYPEDGRLGGEVRTTLAQGEFESASFELFSFQDYTGVQLSAAPLSGPGGAKLEMDVKVVKLWFQNGNGWVSYFDDVGLKLVPELLLHDENLIGVDLETASNYACLPGAEGKKRKVWWISEPKGMIIDSFDPYNPDFTDAESIRPVRLGKNLFKQFFVTVHAAKTQAPGVYKGKIVAACGAETLCEIPVAVRVLPFELPLPRGYFHPEVPYFFSCMSAAPSLNTLTAKCHGDAERARKIQMAVYQSLYDHSVFHAPGIGPGNAWLIPELRKIGFPLNPVFGDLMCPWFGLNFGGRMTFKQLMTAKYGAEKCAAFYGKVLPDAQVFLSHGDEQGAAFVTAQREFYDFYNEKGFKIGCAGHAKLLYKGGHVYGQHPFAGQPDEAGKVQPWVQSGVAYNGFYASQHTGSENPAFVRMQNGLMSWLSGQTMCFNYQFATGPWNDRAKTLYKPMIIAYGSSDGLLDTLAYCGFREACDDIRYGTYLMDLCDKACKSGSIAASHAARKAMLYVSLLDIGTADLNTVRAEMIEHILSIREKMGMK